MTPILPNTDGFSQYSASLDNFNQDSASLDKFDQDYADKLVYQDYADKLVYDDVVVKSGVHPDICRLNFPTAIGEDFYDGLYRDTDKTTNSGGGIEAYRNFARCNGDAGYFLGSKFYQVSDLAGDTKAAKFGIIKSKGIYRPAGMPAIGFRTPSGRYRQLAGAPIALDLNKNTGVWEPRRYHQPKGQPLEIFLPRVTVRIGELVLAKAGLTSSMPEFPVIGLDGEWLGFWNLVLESGCPIVITEGEKKACCLISRGYAAIGLPGIRTGYRVTEYGEEITKPDGTTYRKAIARELCEVLQILDTPGREITILFDFRPGDYSESQEFKAACTTAKLFKNAIAKIAQLPGPDKGIDDFCVAGGNLDKIIANAQDCRKLEIKAQWRRCRNYIPDYIINARYFHTPEPAADTITAIKSGLATGKTQWLKDIIASNPNGKIIVIGSRNGLLLQTAEKCGFYHLDAHNGYLMFKDTNARLCLCFDSLLKLPPDIFEGATIILDEAESVIRHLLMSPTLKHNREAIKQLFTQACQDASRIILLDGHLTDYTVSLIAKLAGNKTVTKHLNEFKGNCPKVSVYQTEKVTATAAEKQEFINRIIASDCPVIATDCSVAEAEALTLTLIDTKGKGLLVCSKNSNDPDELEFQTDPDAWVEKHNPNSIIYTPTLENGLDVSIKRKFTDVFGLFCGNLGVNSLIQMLRRVRHPINQISVLCPQIGLSSNDDKKSYYASQIRHQIEATISIESTLLCPSEHEEVVRADILRQLADPLFYARCHYEAQENLEKSNLREFLIEALIDGGYEVDEPTLGEDESGDHANKKIVCKEQESQEIFNSPDITLEEAQEISRSNKARWPERCQAEKAFLKAKLPAVETTNLWKWEFVHRIRGKDSSLLSHLENSWLFHNPDDAEYLQKSKWESGYFKSFLPDHSTRWLKLRTLHELNIMQFLNSDVCWTNESPEIKKLLKGGERKGIRKILGEPGKDGIKYANKLLGLIGVKLIPRRARGEDGKRAYEYFYQPEPTWRETKAGPKRECSLPEDWIILAELTAARMSQKVEAKRASVKSTETVSPSSVDAVLDSPDFINNQLETSRTETTPENTTAAGAAGAISQFAIEVEPEVAPEFMAEVEAPATEIFVAQIEVTSPELPAVEVPIAAEAPIAQKAWAWYQIKKEWIKCRVLGFVGDCYRLEIKSMVDSGVAIFKAYPEDLRWEAPIC
jgi:hypothetical protein